MKNTWKGKNKRWTLYRTLRQEGKGLSSSYYWYIINQTKCGGIKQWPFYYVHTFVSRKFGMGTAEMACLCSSISGALAGKTWRLGVMQGLEYGTNLRHFHSCLFLLPAAAGDLNENCQSENPYMPLQVTWASPLAGLQVWQPQGGW